MILSPEDAALDENLEVIIVGGASTGGSDASTPVRRNTKAEAKTPRSPSKLRLPVPIQTSSADGGTPATVAEEHFSCTAAGGTGDDNCGTNIPKKLFEYEVNDVELQAHIVGRTAPPQDRAPRRSGQRRADEATDDEGFFSSRETLNDTNGMQTPPQDEYNHWDVESNVTEDLSASVRENGDDDTNTAQRDRATGGNNSKSPSRTTLAFKLQSIRDGIRDARMCIESALFRAGSTKRTLSQPRKKRDVRRGSSSGSGASTAGIVEEGGSDGDATTDLELAGGGPAPSPRRHAPPAPHRPPPTWQGRRLKLLSDRAGIPAGGSATVRPMPRYEWAGAGASVKDAAVESAFEGRSSSCPMEDWEDQPVVPENLEERFAASCALLES